jgi:NAD(P)H-flavin reductase
MIAGAQAQSGPATWHGRVLRHRMLARDLAVLDIATDQPLPYEPGQYITVQHGRWPRVWRQFSVASPPARDGDRLELNVRMVPGGWVSTALTRDTREGSEVTVGPAAGAMTEQAAGGRDLLLIAGGVGLAPLRALAESALAAGESAASGRRSISLFHGATSALGLYAMPGLRELERCYPWFSATGVVSGDPGFRGRRGNVADIALECDWAGRHAFLAGPPGMIASAAAGLAAAGMPAGCVHYDREAAR